MTLLQILYCCKKLTLESLIIDKGEMIKKKNNNFVPIYSLTVTETFQQT